MKQDLSVRVCHILDLYPPIVGGMELHSFELAKRLNKKGLELFVITRRYEPTLKRFEWLENVAVKRITPKGTLKGRGWKALAPVLLFITKMFFFLVVYVNRYDIILVTSLKVLSIPAIIAKSIFHKRCVIMVVSTDELGQDIISDESLKRMRLSRSSFPIKMVGKIRNLLLKRIDCFVALSSEITEQFNRVGFGPEKVRTIPNGIDTRKFFPVSSEQKMTIRKKLSLPQNKIIFCYAGRIAKAKGVMLLAEVWNELSQKHDNIHLILAGSEGGSYDNCKYELMQYIESHNLKNNLFVKGYVDEMNEYLQAADIFVFASDYEGFGLAILEGLACGLPAVLTKVGVAAEIIECYENGVVVSPKNHKEFYDAMEWMLQHKDLWEAIGKNARNSIEKYTIEIETDEYAKLFREINENIGVC